MPFPEKPVDFSQDSLRLLDVALTRAWLERVALGASLSGADEAVCADLRDKIERIKRLQTNGRSAKTGRSEKRMAGHRFKIGERVIFHSPRRSIGPSLFTVLRLLPIEGQEFSYRIKSSEENFERVAKERELTSL